MRWPPPSRAAISGSIAAPTAPATEAQLLALPGVGPWTASYIAMRALGDPDAFPAGDLGLRRTSAGLGGPADTDALERRSHRWRPWRAYAAQHLWTHPGGAR